jgi:hypothetical protein
MCPYLAGSAEGGVCSAKSALLRNLDDIHTDLCMSRHFEVCRIYIEKLQELDVPGLRMNGNMSPILTIT